MHRFNLLLEELRESLWKLVPEFQWIVRHVLLSFDGFSLYFVAIIQLSVQLYAISTVINHRTWATPGTGCMSDFRGKHRAGPTKWFGKVVTKVKEEIRPRSY